MLKRFHLGLLANIATFALVVGLLAAAPATAAAPDVKSAIAPASTSAVGTQERAAKWSAQKFARRWMQAADQRNWSWIRGHSVITRQFGGGVSIEEIKWFMGSNGSMTFSACGRTWDNRANVRTCRTKQAGGNVNVTRRKSGRQIATAFWVED